MKLNFRVIIPVMLILSFTACSKRCSPETDNYTFEKEWSGEDGLHSHLSMNLDLEYVIGGVSDEAVRGMNKCIAQAAFGTVDNSDVKSVKDEAEKFIDRTCVRYDEFLKSIGDWNLMRAADARVAEDSTIVHGSDADSVFVAEWQYIITGSFVGEYDRMVSYVVDSYTYEGGAHGISYRIPIVFDMKTGDMVSENDLFEDESGEDLGRLLSGYLSDHEKYESFFIKDIRPNGKFYVSDRGVTYVYGVYEIAPYYIGTVEVTVPWEDLRDILK